MKQIKTSLLLGGGGVRALLTSCGSVVGDATAAVFDIILFYCGSLKLVFVVDR